MVDASLPAPPGKTGLPLIGETREFLQDTYGFTARRVEKYGPVFQTSFLGKRRIVMSGPEACARWIDESIIQRADSMPGPVLDVFGGVSLPIMDGPAHKARKHLVRRAFDAASLTRYLPELRVLIDGFLADASATDGPIVGVPALRKLAISCICKNVMGLDPGTVVDALVAEYGIVFAAPDGIPLDLPGTSLRRAIAARDRIFTAMDGLIAERRANPTSDGLSAMLQATAPDGTRLDDTACRLELHHLVIAGYIVFGELLGAVLQLDANPGVRKRVRDEIDDELAPEQLSVADLERLDYLHRVVLELKRHTPVVNLFFGIAKQDFELYGYRIPHGRSVMLALTDCNFSTETWSDPARFDPDRFAPDRAEHERHVHAFVPQGPGEDHRSHRCAGVEYTTVLMSVFIIQLLRNYDWILPHQDLSYDWRKIPPEPKDGLLIELTPR